MSPDDFADRVEAEPQSELDRLGSSKRLVAVTGADLSTETVLRRAAASEAAAAAVFEDWASDSTGAAVDAFESFAAREREHHDRVTDELGEDVPSDPGAVHDYLRGLDSTVERAGGVVGRGLVAQRTLTQFVSYFVNDADQARADLFRDLNSDTAADTDRAVDLLAAVCDDEGDWERAQAAAVDVVEVAYEEYAESLASMGVDVKSVC